MRISDICIKRPVFATVLSIVLTLIGLVSYSRLTVREYPNIDEPVVTVETTYRGASAEIVESQVTKIIENSLSGIEGIEYVTSISRSEQSQITARFRIDRDVNAAANDVRDRVARVRGDLPDDIEEPVVSKVEADAEPILYLAFSSDRHSDLEITDFADRVVQDRLQTLPGVADVPIYGERRYAMRIWLDRDRLAAYGLTTQDVEAALIAQNAEIPAGRIEGSRREFTVVSQTDLRTPEEFGNIILKNAEGYLVRMRDVAQVEIGPADDRVIARFQGKSAVALGVVKQSVANPLEVSKAVRAAIPEIEAQLPPGMKIDMAYDSAIFIDRSIEAVYETIAEAVVLVVGVIFLFLRSLRATLVPIVTIPVSLVGAFALMFLFGFSINTLTLLAFVLAIGLVVDDAIVVLENIFRHIEAGMRPLDAALKGMREIGFAVVAMTITLAAVFAPLAFTTGRTGRLFVEFALTLAGAVLISGFVALTLSPMMCGRMLKHAERHGWVYNAIEAVLSAVTNGYRRLLGGLLRLRVLVVLVFLLVAAGGVFAFRLLPSELAPYEDRGSILAIMIGPEGATAAYTDRYIRMIEQLWDGVPEKESYFTVAGFPVVNQGIGFMSFKDWSERSRSAFEIVQSLAGPMFANPGLLAFPIMFPPLGQEFDQTPVQFVVETTGSYEELQQLVDQIMAEAAKNPGLTNLDTDLKLNKPELRIEVDRDKAADLGISVEAIGRTLETLLGSRQVTRFKLEGEQYDVILRMQEQERRRPGDIGAIYVRGRSGEMIPLANLVKVNETVAPRELNHFNKLRAARITASIAPGYSLGQALDFLRQTVARVATTPVSIDYAGQSREFLRASSSLYVVFALALVFIYLVLAAQFESFADPFIIMLTVPTAMTGALAALVLTHGSLNVYSQIGLVTLVGLITKHGILIVEFANQLRARGREKFEAVIEAATLRLRPILMTTGAMVLGAIPLALATGAGAESRHQIGWVIVGGMSLGTLLTLFVVPVAYTLLAPKKMPDAVIEAARLHDAADAAEAEARAAEEGGARKPAPAE
jgi:multidrug efflux pump